MKKNLLLVLLIFSISNISGQNETIENTKKHGLVSYLTAVKSLAEFKMVALSSDSKYTKNENSSKVKDFNSKYILLKMEVDLLVNQLSADLYDSNRLKSYRTINTFVKTNKSLSIYYSNYEILIKEIDALSDTFLMMHYGNMMAGASIEDITGVATLAIETITSARDFREKKIQSTTSLLKELKLKNLGDLITIKEKKEL